MRYKMGEVNNKHRQTTQKNDCKGEKTRSTGRDELLTGRRARRKQCTGFISI